MCIRDRLIIYDNTPAQASNIGFMVQAMRDDPMVDKDRVNEALSAIASNQIPIIQPALNVITANYLIHNYCPVSKHEHEGAGVWWPLKSGQALHFNNYVFHGASTLGPAKRDRFTFDMRVTTYHLNACNSSTYYHSNPVVRASFKNSKDCISKIFGYNHYHHLLEVMFDLEIADKCSDAPMFYFALYPQDTTRDYVEVDGVGHLYITKKALENHLAFEGTKKYFEDPNWKFPEAAKLCMLGAAFLDE